MDDGKWKARGAVVLRLKKIGAGELGICGPQDAKSEVRLRSKGFVCVPRRQNLKKRAGFLPSSQAPRLLPNTGPKRQFWNGHAGSANLSVIPSPIFVVGSRSS